MNTEGMIDITGSDLVAVVKKAYELSEPQGMGIIHYREGGLSDEEAQSLICVNEPVNIVSMDYVLGRCCKFKVFKDGENLYIRSKWYYHYNSDLEKLLEVCEVNEHGN